MTTEDKDYLLDDIIDRMVEREPEGVIYDSNAYNEETGDCPALVYDTGSDPDDPREDSNRFIIRLTDEKTGAERYIYRVTIECIKRED